MINKTPPNRLLGTRDPGSYSTDNNCTNQLFTVSPGMSASLGHTPEGCKERFGAIFHAAKENEKENEKKKIRICYPYIGDSIGGSHLSSIELIKKLDKKKFEAIPLLHKKGILHHTNGRIVLEEPTRSFLLLLLL